MTALIIIGSIILPLAFLLGMNVRAEIRYYGGVLDLKVKYLFFTVFPIRKKKRSSEEEQPAGDSDDKVWDRRDGGVSAEHTEDPENREQNIPPGSESSADNGNAPEKTENESLSEKTEKLGELLEKAKIVWKICGKRLKRIFKHIYLKDLVIDFTVADEDACKAAVSYGAVSAATYSVIAAVGTLFPTTIKTVDIICGFNEKKTAYDGEVKVALRLGTAVSAALGILLGLAANYGRLSGKAKLRNQSE